MDKNTSRKSGILCLSASDCKIWLMSYKCNELTIYLCVQIYFNFQKKIKITNLVTRIPRTKIWAENLKPKVLATIFKKKFHPRMGIFQLPPSKCPCKDFSISLFLHPNNLGSRMRMKFFQNLKFRVYNAVSLLAIGVRKRVTRYNWHGNNLSTVSICHFCRLA